MPHQQSMYAVNFEENYLIFASYIFLIISSCFRHHYLTITRIYRLQIGTTEVIIVKAQLPGIYGSKPTQVQGRSLRTKVVYVVTSIETEHCSLIPRPYSQLVNLFSWNIEKIREPASRTLGMRLKHCMVWTWLYGPLFDSDWLPEEGNYGS